MITPLSDVFVEVRRFLTGPIINALETGCSFAWTPDNFNNLSTLNITSHLLKGENDRLLSIDKDPNNVSRCLSELRSRRLDYLVKFACGESLIVMRDEIEKGPRFNFFWLDSEENEDHGLEEYEFALKLMVKPSVVCIDDYGSSGSVKWRKSSEKLKLDSFNHKVYTTPTGLIVGFFNT